MAKRLGCRGPRQIATILDSVLLMARSRMLGGHSVQADYAALVGVSALTIYNWEHGRSRPRSAQLEAWGAIRNLGKREAWRRLEDL